MRIQPVYTSRFHSPTCRFVRQPGNWLVGEVLSFGRDPSDKPQIVVRVAVGDTPSVAYKRFRCKNESSHDPTAPICAISGSGVRGYVGFDENDKPFSPNLRIGDTYRFQWFTDRKFLYKGNYLLGLQVDTCDASDGLQVDTGDASDGPPRSQVPGHDDYPQNSHEDIEPGRLGAPSDDIPF